MEQLPILIGIGIVAGIMSGMFGIGGGAIIVPSLILFLDFTQIEANGTSLAALLLPVGILGCIAYYRQDKLRFIPAGLVALGLTGGAWFGAGIALDLPADVLKQSYGVFLLYMAWRYIAPRKWWREWRGAGEEKVQEDTNINFREPRAIMTLLGIGLLAGVFSGLFGIGGGVVIVPALMTLLGFDQKLATGTSLGALLLPVGLPGVSRYYEAGQLDLAAAVPLALMLLIFAFFGARLALGLPTKTVKRLYGFFLLFVGLRFLFG
jgi:uncharacterized membrane protein YfcA